MMEFLAGYWLASGSKTKKPLTPEQQQEKDKIDIGAMVGGLLLVCSLFGGFAWIMSMGGPMSAMNAIGKWQDGFGAWASQNWGWIGLDFFVILASGMLRDVLPGMRLIQALALLPAMLIAPILIANWIV